MRLDDLLRDGESLALAPSFVLMRKVQVPFSPRVEYSQSRWSGPVSLTSVAAWEPNTKLISCIQLLPQFIASSFLHGTRIKPSKAEEEIKKWFQISHPSSILESEAISRKATDRGLGAGHPAIRARRFCKHFFLSLTKPDCSR